MKISTIPIYVLLLLMPATIFAERAGFTERLVVPPLLEDLSADPQVARFSLVAGESSREFLPGLLTPTYGFNGSYLGPTIRVREGQRVEIAVLNNLGETTTVHWHGLHVPGDMDGGPHQTIGPGETWQPAFDIIQQAATLWYHPHQMGKTGEHVYRGLAGLFIIDDENSDALDIPDEYGTNDIPLIVQDRRFYENGEFAYVTGMPDLMHGVIGNHVLVNGQHEPFVEVAPGLVRLRLLNGSDSTIHRYRLSDGAAFRQIASDGGYLQRAVEHESLILSPGERAEILIDLSGSIPGDSLFLDVDLYTGGSYHAVELVTSSEVAPSHRVPAKFNTIQPIPESEAGKTRVFEMQTGGMGSFSINGAVMDMGRIDHRIPLGSTEIWEITNVPMGMMSIPHSFHVHDVQFQILDINGETPPPHLAGWKDTVLLWPEDTVRIIARFEDVTGVFMYHCHLLVHEDQGMMGQFEVY